MNIQYIHPADQLVMFMQRIYDKGLTTMSGGNLSIMDNDGNIWITPAGVDKGTLTRRDIICVKPDGTVIGPHKPSSELPFHISVYKMRPDLHAVLHAHPPALVAFSIVRRLPDLDLILDRAPRLPRGAHRDLRGAGQRRAGRERRQGVRRELRHRDPREPRRLRRRARHVHGLPAL
jgi:ribulose-5-phosphate 4-epimerase/fuculose-1-phosphate aldolase